MSCVNGTTTLNAGYPTSNDCPPAATFNIGTLPVDFALSSGTVTWTGTQATNDTGSTAGSQGNNFAGYCRDSDSSLCFKGDPDTACPASTPGFQECWRNGMAIGAACSGVFESCMQRNNGAFGPSGDLPSICRKIGILSRVCWDSSGVYHSCRQMDHGGEALIGLVGAHGDAFEFLEFAEEVLDQVSPLVELGVDPQRRGAPWML